jgi:hypothetical protein
MSSQGIEDRLAALEAEVRQLRKMIDRKGAPGWRRMVGAFANDPYFDEAMDYGRRYRKSTRPPKEKKRKNRHGNS